MHVLFASDKEDAEAVESLVKAQPAEGQDDMESLQHSSPPDTSFPSVEPSGSLTNQETGDHATVSSETEETPSQPLPSDHSPKSKVTWKSLGKRRFNYDILPKVFYNVKNVVNSAMWL